MTGAFSPELKAKAEAACQSAYYSPWKEALKPETLLAMFAEHEEVVRERDAGREWMRRAWYELNAIKARDGAPSGVDHEWWAELTDALSAMLGDETVPWTTTAAQRLLAPAERDRDALRRRVEGLEAALKHVECKAAVYGDHAYGDIARAALSPATPDQEGEK